VNKIPLNMYTSELQNLKIKAMKPLKSIFTTLLIILCISISPLIRANVTIPAIFSDHMVLQQRTLVTLWGWGKPGETVSVTGSWDPDTTYTTRVPNHSVWSMEIRTPEAGGPYELVIRGYNTIGISDVLIGEVWLGSGQSNMEWTASSGIDNQQEEIAAADYPEIRFFQVNTTIATCPQQLVEGHWVVCTPETMAAFSAVLYFFGRDLHRELDVPVGLISSAWGGTPVEIWMPEAMIRGDRLLEMNAGFLKPVPWGPVEPGVAYNAMIHPLIPYRIKGALWYQGEANVDFPQRYARALSTLIGSWRAAWGNTFPFYYVQIAPWAGYGNDNVKGAVLRDQQRLVMERTPQTGMVVVSDIGDLNNIHPRNKLDVGKRLAAWALHNDYGFSDLPYSGPLPQSAAFGSETVTIRFDHAEGGLVARDGVLKEFEVLDPEGNWISADARIAGNSVEVDVPVPRPEGVRYGYRNDSQPTLFNAAGLPASCFEWLNAKD
jgi:sialate O-acetylesterase